MSKKCARCEKTVYPLEELKCLDKIWHKGCFKCQECAMTLSMKTYKGFNKLPYCEAHIPKAKATTVAETPESRRLAENTKNQSNVQYHAEFEKTKAKFTQVADDPETARLKKNTKIISNVSYHGTLEQKADMERKRDDENGTSEQQYDGEDSTAVPVHPPQHNSPQHHSPPHPAPVPQHSPYQHGSSSDSDVPPGKGRLQYYEEEGVEDTYHGGVEVPEYNSGHPQRGYNQNHNHQNYSSSPHGQQQQGGVVIRSGGVAVRGGSVGGGGSGQGSNRSSSELSSHGHYPPNTNRHSQGSYPQYPPTNNQYATGAPVPREDLQRQQLQLQQQQQQQAQQLQREQIQQQQQQQQQQLLQQQKQQQQQQQLLLQQQQQQAQQLQREQIQQQQQQHHHHQQQYNNVPPQQQSYGAPPNAHGHRHPQQQPNTQSYLHHQHQQPQHNHHNQHPQQPSHHNHAPPQNLYNDANHNNSPYSARTSQTLIYTSQTGPVESQGGHRVGSIVDYDPMNEQYGSIAPKQNSAGGGYRQQQTYQVQRSNLYGGDPGQGQPQQVVPPPQVNSNAAQQQQQNNASQHQQHKVNAPPTQLGRCYRAQYDYEAADTDEVSFRDGDLIVNCTPIDEGWMTGQVQRSGQTGMLPANYVERVS